MRGVLLAAIFVSSLCVTGANADTQSQQSAPASVSPESRAAASLAHGQGNNCASKYYPATAIRLNHEGNTVVSVHIDATGKVTGADVAQSSGYPDLDDAATQCVVEAWHFSPATSNGKPIASTKQYRIVWKLTGPVNIRPWLKNDTNGICNPLFWNEKTRWPTYRAATLVFRLSAEGKVEAPFIALSSGDPEFDAKAVVCMTKLAYTPAIVEGQPSAISWTASVLWSPQTGLAFADGRGIGPLCPDSAFPANLWKGDPSNPTDISFQSSATNTGDFAIEKQSGNSDLDQAAMTCVKSATAILPAGPPGSANFGFLVRFIWHQGHAFSLSIPSE